MFNNDIKTVLFETSRLECGFSYHSIVFPLRSRKLVKAMKALYTDGYRKVSKSDVLETDSVTVHSALKYLYNTFTVIRIHDIYVSPTSIVIKANVYGKDSL